jgi:predicted nucleic acid-binding protein
MDGHPGRLAAERETERGSVSSTVLVLLECYHVLIRDYDISATSAARYTDHLVHSSVHWVSAEPARVTSALLERQTYDLQGTDAVLLVFAREDGGTLVTTDRRLLREAQAQGVAVRNPISPELAEEISRWESLRLPPKGLARLMATVERWRRAQDTSIAERFSEATNGLRHPPA